MPRPKEFDPDDALAKAMEVFWAQGYEATSVQNLVDAMGINRFSLYDTFGDKHALFLAALDRYGATVADEGFAALEASDDGLAAIRAFFLGHVEALAGEGAERGCLFVNCSAELAAHDEDAAGRVRRGISRAERSFRSALERAQEAGDIAPGCDLDDLARFLTTCSQGMAVVAKARPGRDFLESSARVILETVQSTE